MNTYDEALSKVLDHMLAMKKCVVVDEVLRQSMLALFRDSEYTIKSDSRPGKMLIIGSLEDSVRLPTGPPTAPITLVAVCPVTLMWRQPLTR